LVNRFQKADPASDEPQAEPNANGGGPEAVRRAQRQLEELVEYARLYVSARSDAVKVRVVRLGLLAVAGFLLLLVAGSVAVTAAVISLLGIAGAIGDALDGRLWAGYLITGGGLLLSLALAVVVTLRAVRRGMQRRMSDKYERRHQQQRERFGHDVSQQAARRKS
jgi:hypothetical protein